MEARSRYVARRLVASAVRRLARAEEVLASRGAASPRWAAALRRTMEGARGGARAWIASVS